MTTIPDSLASAVEFFGPPISTYTRADALADGTLVDAGDLAREAGYNLPLALTRAAWNDLVEWTDADEKRKGCTGQSPTGRLWDVLNVGRAAMKAALRDAVETDGTSNRYGSHVYRVKREGRGTMPRRADFRVNIGGDDNGRPCITIMLPSES